MKILKLLLIFYMAAVAANAQEISLKKAEPRHPIPLRSLQANQDLIDLTEYYTTSLDDDWLVKQGANLSSLPRGVQAFAQAAFDVRGIIQLAGKTVLTETGIDFTKEVKGIRINSKLKRLHFLHGAAWSVSDDTKIGEYIIHYSDGRTASIPIIYQRNIRDWFIQKGDQIPSDADIAWTGENQASQKLGYNIQLYKYTVNNPFPGLEIETIDFVSTVTECGPFLIAITVEPDEHAYDSYRNVRIDNPIIPRSPEAGKDLVDLSDYYNTSPEDDWFNHPGHDLQDLPKGIQIFDGVKFDVRGMIVLAGAQSLGISGVVFPESVKGIQVHLKGQKLHFLHACGFSDEPGTKIGAYVIHYADGQMRTVPILYQVNILDWWSRPNAAPPAKAAVVWKGQNPSTRNAGFITHLIKYTWENPLPQIEISTIDFVSEVKNSAPFLMAITIE